MGSSKKDTIFIHKDSTDRERPQAQRRQSLGYQESARLFVESACNAGDLGSIPGLGRSPGEGKGYPLQYSGLENSMDYTVHGVANSWTRLSDFHFLFLGSVSGFLSLLVILCLFLLFMGFSKQEYWSGLPFLPPEDEMVR